MAVCIILNEVLLVFSDCIMVDSVWVHTWCSLSCCPIDALVMTQVAIQQAHQASQCTQDQQNHHS